MRPFELSRDAYWLDLRTAPLLIVTTLGVLVGPPVLAAFVGFAMWSFAEYAVHRWVFHGRSRFAAGHVDHHERPLDFVGATPALAVIGGLAALAAAYAVPLLSSFLVGLLLGYLGYFVVHSALHHAPPRPTHPLAPALLRHSRHHAGDAARDFGVTTAVWDRVFGTVGG